MAEAAKRTKKAAAVLTVAFVATVICVVGGSISLVNWVNSHNVANHSVLIKICVDGTRIWRRDDGRYWAYNVSTEVADPETVCK